MIRTFFYSLTLAALTGVGFLGLAPAQAQDDEKLLLVIRTGPEIKLNSIRDTVKNALTVLSGLPKDYHAVIKGEPVVKTITAADYNAYLRLENPDTPLVPLPGGKNGDIEVRQLPAATTTWEFHLSGTTPQELTKLDVTYDDAIDKPVTLKPTSIRNDPLTITQFGSYVLTPPAKKTPLKYTAYLRDLGAKEDRKVEGDWPRGDNFYLISLSGFKGDRKRLGEIIQDREAVGGSALEAFNIKTGVTLAIGEAGATDDEQGEESIEGNKLFVSVPSLRRTKVSRAYMLFPIVDEQQAEAELKKLNAMSENELIEYIRNVKPIPGNQDVVITSTMKPIWVELPLIDEKTAGGGLKSGTFGRVMYLASKDGTLVNAAAYRMLLDKFPHAYRIVVYEFDNGTIRNAVPYKRTPTQKGRTLANSSLMNVWEIQLARLSSATEAEPKEKTEPKPKESKP